MPANESTQTAQEAPKPLTLHALLLELVPAALGLPGPSESKTSLAAPRRCAASAIMLGPRPGASFASVSCSVCSL